MFTNVWVAKRSTLLQIGTAGTLEHIHAVATLEWIRSKIKGLFILIIIIKIVYTSCDCPHFEVNIEFDAEFKTDWQTKQLNYCSKVKEIELSAPYNANFQMNTKWTLSLLRKSFCGKKRTVQWRRESRSNSYKANSLRARFQKLKSSPRGDKQDSQSCGWRLLLKHAWHCGGSLMNGTCRVHGDRNSEIQSWSRLSITPAVQYNLARTEKLNKRLKHVASL